jgi:carotenoid cleavage dioxygenase-like enzyme
MKFAESSSILRLLLLLVCRHKVTSFSVSRPPNRAAGSCSASSSPSAVLEQEEEEARESSSSSSTGPSVPFLEWIADATDEVTEWRELVVEGVIPSYLKGSLVRNGGGVWSASGDDSSSSYLHIFDGLAKVSAWRINGESSSVQYRNQFIQSKMYQTTMRQHKLPVTITAGPSSSSVTGTSSSSRSIGMWELVQAVINSPGMDNAPVNIWDYDPENTTNDKNDNDSSSTPTTKKRITARTDSPARADLSLEDLSTRSTFGTLGPPVDHWNGVVVLETAHPLYGISSSSSDTTNSNHQEVATYNVATVVTIPRGLEIAVIRELPNGTRTVVASHPAQQGNVPYIHSFGITDRYVIAILQPLRLNLLDLSTTLQQGFLRAMQEVAQTEVMVFDLQEERLVFHECTNEKVFFYHSVSSTVTTTTTDGHRGGDRQVSVRLCAYRTADMITGEHHFLRLDQARQGAEFRNQIPKGGIFCDITAHLDTKSLTVEWMDQQEIEQGFELPTTRYSRSYRKEQSFMIGNGQHPRYVYAYGAYANGSPNYDDWGLYKFDLLQRKVAARFVQPLHFPSEPIFVPNPAGTSEDDGVVLVQMYDGTKKETGLFVLDGISMQVVATVWTQGHRSPMDFHGGWIPN